MKNNFLAIAIVLTSLFSTTVFSQSKEEPVSLGLPGDNLDLYAVMEIFQKSKTIEDFETTLNTEKDGINNLDLDNDNKVDFIKVVTDKDGDSFSFVLQVAVSKTETQDVAVVFVSKDANNQTAIQIVGDEDLYGNNYVIEPKGYSGASTANPGYSGGEVMNLPAATEPNTTVVIQQAPPIVQYVYSPMYVPYFSPFYYMFFPPYFHPWFPLSYGMYWGHHYHCHGGYYGGYRGSVNININNSHHYHNYHKNSRNRSNTVSNLQREGRYKNNGKRSSVGNLNKENANSLNKRNKSNSKLDKKSNRSSNRATSSTNRASRPSTKNTGTSTRQRPTTTTRPTTTRPAMSRPSSGGARSGGGMRAGRR